jgi:hypothetical protein
MMIFLARYESLMPKGFLSLDFNKVLRHGCSQRPPGKDYFYILDPEELTY